MTAVVVTVVMAVTVVTVVTVVTAAAAMHGATWLCHAYLEARMNRALRVYRVRWHCARHPAASVVRELHPCPTAVRFWMAPGAAVFYHLFFLVVFALYVGKAPAHHESLEGFLGALALLGSQALVCYSMFSQAGTVTAVLVENGAPVEYGQDLIVIE